MNSYYLFRHFFALSAFCSSPRLPLNPEMIFTNGYIFLIIFIYNIFILYIFRRRHNGRDGDHGPPSGRHVPKSGADQEPATTTSADNGCGWR